MSTNAPKRPWGGFPTQVEAEPTVEQQIATAKADKAKIEARMVALKAQLAAQVAKDAEKETDKNQATDGRSYAAVAWGSRGGDMLGGTPLTTLADPDKDQPKKTRKERNRTPHSPSPLDISNTEANKAKKLKNKAKVLETHAANKAKVLEAHAAKPTRSQFKKGITTDALDVINSALNTFKTADAMRKKAMKEEGPQKQKQRTINIGTADPTKFKAYITKHHGDLGLIRLVAYGDKSDATICNAQVGFTADHNLARGIESVWVFHDEKWHHFDGDVLDDKKPTIFSSFRTVASIFHELNALVDSASSGRGGNSTDDSQLEDDLEAMFDTTATADIDAQIARSKREGMKALKALEFGHLEDVWTKVSEMVLCNELNDPVAVEKMVKEHMSALDIPAMEAIMNQLHVTGMFDNLDNNNPNACDDLTHQCSGFKNGHRCVKWLTRNTEEAGDKRKRSSIRLATFSKCVGCCSVQSDQMVSRHMGARQFCNSDCVQEASSTWKEITHNLVHSMKFNAEPPEGPIWNVQHILDIGPDMLDGKHVKLLGNEMGEAVAVLYLPIAQRSDDDFDDTDTVIDGLRYFVLLYKVPRKGKRSSAHDERTIKESYGWTLATPKGGQGLKTDPVVYHDGYVARSGVPQCIHCRKKNAAHPAQALDNERDRFEQLTELIKEAYITAQEMCRRTNLPEDWTPLGDVLADQGIKFKSKGRKVVQELRPMQPGDDGTDGEVVDYTGDEEDEDSDSD